jgi:hypothetical protein
MLCACRTTSSPLAQLQNNVSSACNLMQTCRRVVGFDAVLLLLQVCLGAVVVVQP